MFQIDEKVIADNRTLISIQDKKTDISPLLKNGTIHYEMETDNLYLTTPIIRSNYLYRDPNLYDYFDKIVLARGGTNIDASYIFDMPQQFSDNVTMDKDLTIAGNLYVNGESTIVNSATMSIDDNIIELNRNEKGNGLTLRKSGIAINRGFPGFSRFLYNEDKKGFVLDDNDAMDGEFDENTWAFYAHTGDYDIYKAGDVRVKNKIYVPYLDVADTLNVLKQTNLKDLSVSGTSTFTGAMAANGALTVAGTLTANGATTLNGWLTANKPATFKDNVLIEQKLTINNGLLSKVLSEFNAGIKITAGGATITGATAVTGAISATDNISTAKNLSVSGDATVTGKTTTGTLEATVLALLKALNVTDTTTTKDLSVTNNASVAKTLSVATSTLLGNQSSIVTIDQINAANNKKVGDVGYDVKLDLNNDGIIDIYDSSLAGRMVGNVLSVGGRSLFGGEAHFREAVHIKNAAKLYSTLNVVGDVVLDKTLSVTGTSTFTGDVSATNNITSAKTVEANILLADTFLNIKAVDGNGIKFWDGSDNSKIFMAAQSFAGAGRLDTTSDYNMYLRMASGTNRGFVFQNGITNIAQIESTGLFRTLGEHYVKYSGAWKKVLHEGNMGHNNGIDVDTLDTLHSTSFLRRDSDDNTTGKLTFNGTVWDNNDGANNPFVIKNTNSIGASISLIPTTSAVANGTKGWSILAASTGANPGDGNFSIIEHRETAASAMLKLIRSTGEMYIGDGATSKVWHAGNDGHNSTLDADTIDTKHSTDLLLLDGTQKMKAILNMATYGIKWADNDTLEYSDTDVAIGSKTYGGKWSFKSDGLAASSLIETGGLLVGNINVLNNGDIITGVKEIDGAFGTMLKSTDEWLRINDDASHTNGVFFGSSLIRTDKALHVGNLGETLFADATAFKYKNYDVITTAGGTMVGDLNMRKNKIGFNYEGFDGTSGIANTDFGWIYGEHDKDVNISRLIIEVKNDMNDAIVFRTNAKDNVPISTKDSLKISFDSIIFADRPKVGTVDVLLKSDMGSGKLLDADTLDTKHYSDLVSEFVNVGGDIMTGALTLNTSVQAPIVAKSSHATDVWIDIRKSDNSRFGYLGYWSAYGNSLVLRNGTANGDIVLAPDGTGTAKVLGNRIVTVADYGTGKGIDADKLDGQEGSYYATATHVHDERYIQKNEVDLNNKYQIKYNAELNSLDFMYIG